MRPRSFVIAALILSMVFVLTVGCYVIFFQGRHHDSLADDAGYEKTDYYKNSGSQERRPEGNTDQTPADEDHSGHNHSHHDH